MIDITILSYNRSRLLKICIEEIKKRTSTTHRIIVLDNGSTDGSDLMLEAMLEDQLIDQLVLLDENTGVHWGFGRLLELVQSDPYICSDGDLVPCMPVEGEDWLQRLLKLQEKNPEFAAISCRPHIFIGGVPDWDESEEVIEVPWAGAALRLMQSQLVRKAGGWEKVKRPSRDAEERWISGKLQNLGYKVGYARDVRCIHLFGEPDLGEDPWGYPIGTAHGHREVWPPVYQFSWNRVGVDWETCR